VFDLLWSFTYSLDLFESDQAFQPTNYPTPRWAKPGVRVWVFSGVGVCFLSVYWSGSGDGV